MASTTSMLRSVSPIALRPDEGEALWFLGHLAIVKAAGEVTGGRFAMIENLVPQGLGPPLHMHRREDEWFYVLDGELTFWVDGRVIAAPARSFVYGPRNIPHTFTVASLTARYLVAVQPAGFENFVRTLARPAEALTLPPSGVAPPSPERLTKVAREYGIEILGPPGIPQSTDS